MKERGLKYHDLAAHLGLSLATVKKFMAEENLDLARLLAICAWLQLSLAELAEVARAQDDGCVRFTPAQEEFFAQNMPYFSYFEALMGQSPAQIAQRHGLSARSTREYLKGLEAIGLIERLPEGRVRLLKRGTTVMWDDFGPMGRTYSRYYVRAMADRAAAALAAPGKLRLWTGSRSLTPAQHEELRTDLDAVLAKYRALGGANRATRAACVPLQYLIVTDEWKDPYFDAIPNV